MPMRRLKLDAALATVCTPALASALPQVLGTWTVTSIVARGGPWPPALL